MKLIAATLLLSGLAVGCSASPAPPTVPELKTDEEKTIYALGLVISDNIGEFHLSEAELEILKTGLTDGALKRSRKVELETFGPKIQGFAGARGAQAAVKAKAAGTAVLQKAAAEEGAKKLDSGVVIQTLQEGTGKSPTPADTVNVHYTGTLTDGTVFDSSVKRGQPVSFQVGKVIPCWSQVLPLMKEGGKAKVYCPAEFAYGDRGAPPRIGPGETLIFEVELLQIAKQGS